MLISYLKIAWKVLLRRKFFTAISLFGISFTLMILLVVFALFDHLTGAHMPEKRIGQMLFVPTLRWEYKDNKGWSNGPMSPYFVDAYVRTMKTPAQAGMTSNVGNATAFSGGKLLPLDIRYTDSNFWQIMEFDFREGRAFTGDEVKRAQPVCVINEATARTYFGTATGVVGRTIEVNLQKLRVAGVVPNVSAAHLYSYADVWLPYTRARNLFGDKRLVGEFVPVLLAPSSAAVPAVQAEFAAVMRRMPVPTFEGVATVQALHAHADPVLATVTRQLLASDNKTKDDNLGIFYTVCALLGLLFMTLPALNLVNLNVTRILERSSEIGVRKAFGATRRALVGQFLVENLVLAAVGGALGLALAAGALQLLNESHVVAYAQFNLSAPVFGWGLLMTLFFGLLSGVYPAWKMARLNPSTALHGNADRG